MHVAIGQLFQGVCAAAARSIVPARAEMATAENGVTFADRPVLEMGVTKLAQYGMMEESARLMAERAKRASGMRYNLVELSDEVLGDVLLSAGRQ